MNITLKDIETAVRHNFLIRSGTDILLEVYKDRQDGYDPQSARIIFVGFASQQFFTVNEIRGHLNMTLFDYHSKIKRFKEIVESGEKKVQAFKQTGRPMHELIDRRDSDRDYYLYRKAVLVRNCLRLMLKTKVIELRESLPDYVD